MNPEALNALAREIADETACADIETACIETFTVGGENSGHWFYTKQLDTPGCEAAVDRAVRYLEARGLLQRHSHDANLVRPLAAKGGDDR